MRGSMRESLLIRDKAFLLVRRGSAADKEEGRLHSQDAL
jgi:hypothetical protein